MTSKSFLTIVNNVPAKTGDEYKKEEVSTTKKLNQAGFRISSWVKLDSR